MGTATVCQYFGHVLACWLQLSHCRTSRAPAPSVIVTVQPLSTSTRGVTTSLHHFSIVRFKSLQAAFYALYCLCTFDPIRHAATVLLPLGMFTTYGLHGNEAKLPYNYARWRKIPVHACLAYDATYKHVHMQDDSLVPRPHGLGMRLARRVAYHLVGSRYQSL